MSRFRIDSMGMRLTRTDGRHIFNSSDKLFHPISTITGVKAMQAWAAGYSVHVNRTEVFNLGAVNPACTQVIGAMKFTLNNYAAGTAFDRWTMVMGGSILWVLDGEQGDGRNLGLSQIVTYHFDVAGGQCRLIQRVALDGAIAANYTVRSHSIEYKLRCGVWV